MSRRLLKIANAVRLGGSSPLVAGAGVVTVLVAVVAIVALITWLRHDPNAAKEERERAAHANDPPPKSPEAAINVAREVFTLMAGRRFAEALPMTDGPAAELLNTELRQQLAPAAKDPELMRLLNKSMMATVMSFEVTNVAVSDKGETVTLSCKSMVSFMDGRRTVTPQFRMRWAFDRWIVQDLNPNAGNNPPPTKL